jgi:uncharacterized protein YfaS (alpha-2-macroglobulin family)
VFFVLSLLLLFSEKAMSQFNQDISDYPSIQFVSSGKYNWDFVNEKIKKGLPREALIQIQILSDQAISDTNLYDFMLSLSLIEQQLDRARFESKEYEQFIWNYNEKADSIPFPLNNILHKSLATWIYRLKASRKISLNDESLSWTIDGVKKKLNEQTLENLIHYHQNKTLTNAVGLMAFANPDLPTSNYQRINISTTLFDLLAGNLIHTNYHSHNRYHSERLTDPVYFASTDELSEAEHLKDSINQTLLLFYHLEKLNWNNKRYENYAHLTTERLSFVKDNFVNDQNNKNRLDSLEENAWIQLETKLQNDSNSTHFSYLLASKYNLEAKAYHWRLSPESKLKNQEALAKIKLALTRFPSSANTQQLISLKKSIEEASLEFHFKGSFLPSTKNVLSIAFRNIDKAVLTIYKIEHERELWDNTNPLKNYQLTYLSSEDLVLEQDEFHLYHDKDFIVQELNESGKYLFLVTATKEDGTRLIHVDSLYQNTKFAYQIAHVSNLAALKFEDKGNYQLLVVNAKTGLPIEGSHVELTPATHSNSTENYNTQTTFLTDKNGMVQFKGAGAYTYQVNFMNDSLKGNLYSYTPTHSSLEKFRVYMDRSIYRPGQKFSCKVLAYSEENYQTKLEENKWITIQFFDRNNKELHAASVKTNDFGTGSITGELPKNEFLLGTVRVVLNGVYVSSFHVEEYKRPSFEVLIDKPSTQLILGDSVLISGSVQALSGYPIADAQVKIKVVQYNYLFESYFRSQSFSKQTDLETWTDQNGLFNVYFYAEKVDGSFGSNVEITATVSDQSGEVQESISSIYIGNKRFTITTELSTELYSENKNKALISVENSDGVKQDLVPVRYKLTKIRQSNWHTDTWIEAEYTSFTQEEFKLYFPTVSYYEGSKLEKLEVVSSGEMPANTVLNIDSLTHHKPGKYRLELNATDETGTQISFSQDFLYYSKRSASKQPKSEFWSIQTQKEAQLGETVSVYLGTQYKNLKVFVEYRNMYGPIHSEWLTLNKRSKLTYTIQTRDKYGVGMTFIGIRNGKSFQDEVKFKIPSKLDKDLHVKLITERDYLQPGSKEKWKLIVQDDNTKNIPSELMVNMYDASLDVFSTHHWKTDFKLHPYLKLNWQAQLNTSIIDNRSSWYTYRRIYMDSPVRMMSEQNGNQEIESFSINLYKTKFDNSEEVIFKSKVRSNFTETAFFIPALYKNSEGNYTFDFELPDALTRWRFMAMAHTSELQTGYMEKSFEARKVVMIQANAPRFFREGDTYLFSSKVVNTSNKEQQVKVKLSLFDPLTSENIDSLFGVFPDQMLLIDANSSKTISWKLQIPVHVKTSVAYRVEATGFDFTDAEQKSIPILSNMQLVTLTMPISKVSKGSTTYKMTGIDKLSEQTQPVSLTLEVQTDPLWTALFSLPSIMKPESGSSEQLFTSYFSNLLARKIIQDNPSFKSLIESWKTNDTTIFSSELEKDLVLKSILLNETPWLQDAASESERKARLVQLFDGDQLTERIETGIQRLKALQLSDGGWGWYKGMSSNAYMTQHIVLEFGHLKQLGISIDTSMVNKALDFLEHYHTTRFQRISDYNKNRLQGLSALEVHWLAAQSIFNRPETEASSYYLLCFDINWSDFSLYTQALAGISALNVGRIDQAEVIKYSILDRATIHPEMGMYWNSNKQGYLWHQSPIETQSALIELFTRLGGMENEIQQMKLWLLQQKRSNSWGSSIATSKAAFVLLMDTQATTQQTNQKVHIKLGDGTDLGIIEPRSDGHFMWKGGDLTIQKTRVSISSENNQPIFGGMYFTYLDKVENLQKSDGDMRMERHYYLTENSTEREVLPGEVIPVGIKLTVKITLITNNDMEYIYVKDPKPAGFENVDKHAVYKYQTIGYYQVNKDASTNFFIESLPKGSNTITYAVFVTGKGTLNNGAAVMECLYAPIFKANSKGATFRVE